MHKTALVVVRLSGLMAAAVALAACDITIGAAEYSVREEKAFPVTGATRLALSTFDGSIEVRGWDRNEVRVEIEKTGPDQATVDKIKVKATQDGNGVTIDVQKPSPLTSSGIGRTPSANFVVSVPRRTTITARSGDGSITIRRVNGRLDLDTDDGSVRVEEVEGTLVARTGDGDVHGRKMDGEAEIHTGDGTVGIDGVLTGLKVETRDGAVDVTARPGSRTQNEWEVITGDGDIRVEVPKDFGAEVDARTGDGRVRVDTITNQPGGNKEEREDRDAVTGKLGGGGNTMRLRTSSGSITVKTW